MPPKKRLTIRSCGEGQTGDLSVRYAIAPSHSTHKIANYRNEYILMNVFGNRRVLPAHSVLADSPHFALVRLVITSFCRLLAIVELTLTRLSTELVSR